ncbi:MAG: LuxR C-terminal-related transcriptional regulator [Pseudomonadota bacterium]
MRPFLEDPESPPNLRVLDGIASWCGGLHGSMPLGDALKALALGLGANAAAITRHHHRTEDRPRLVALVPGALSAPLARAYCNDVLDYQFGRARAGSVWFLTEMLEDPSWRPTRELERLHRTGAIKEVAVIPMSVTRQSIDYIEFHFAVPLSRARQNEIEALVPTIERSWTGRKPGLVAQATADGRTPLARSAVRTERQRWDSPILGMANPAGLSRAEFRVCLLLSRGLSVKAVSQELGLSDNTVRSHLRTIYSKTETSSLPELIYLIMSVTEDEETLVQTAYRA